MNQQTTKLVFLSPEDFLTSRPNMQTYSTDEIQEAINTSDEMINAVTNGLSSQVIDFNLVSDRTTLDTTNELYRTDYEWKNLKIAYVTQTQYTLQMANNWTQGSESFSSGGINAAFQRPTNRDVYAPTLFQLLTIAKVYVLQSIGIDKESQKKCSSVLDNYYTKDQSNTRFVTNLQTGAKVGQVAIIDSNQKVSFADANTIDFKIYKTNQILYSNGNYYPIYELPDLAWVSGTNKNVFSEQETIDKINEIITNYPDLNITLFFEGEKLSFSSPVTYASFKTATKTSDSDFQVVYNNDNSVSLTCLKDIMLSGMFQVDGSSINLAQNPSFVNLSTTLNTIRDSLQEQITTNKNNISALSTKVDSLQSEVNNVVKLTGDQSISGVKTFATDIVVPSTPAQSKSAVCKQYLIDNYVSLAGTETVSGLKRFRNAIFLNGNANVGVGQTGAKGQCTGISFSNGGNIGVWFDVPGQLQISSFTKGVKINSTIAANAPIGDSDLTTKKYVTDTINAKMQETNLSNLVTLNGAQTISGIKSFSTQPITIDPVASNQVANKNYVDTQITTVNSTVSDVSAKATNNSNTISVLERKYSFLADLVNSSNSTTGFYVQGQITSVAQFTVPNSGDVPASNKLVRMDIFTNIDFDANIKNCVNVQPISCCITNFNQITSFTPVQWWRDGNSGKLVFRLVTMAGTNISSGWNVVVFLMKTRNASV